MLTGAGRKRLARRIHDLADCFQAKAAQERGSLRQQPQRRDGQGRKRLFQSLFLNDNIFPEP